MELGCGSDDLADYKSISFEIFNKAKRRRRTFVSIETFSQRLT